MSTVKSFIPAGKRLTSADAEWLDGLANATWGMIFATLDAEFLVDGEFAGKVAAAASDAVLAVMVPEYAVDVPVARAAGLTC